MAKIYMLSEPYRIKKIKRKTKAKGFEDYREGDIIRLSSVLSHQGRTTRGGVLASDITVHNTTQGTKVTKTQTQTSKLLEDTFELEEDIHA